jgi:hypothetical protein
MPLLRASAKADRRRVVSAHTTRSHIRVETVEGIVGELPGVRGNKVFQVVTPARQGSAGFFAILKSLKRQFYLAVFQVFFDPIGFLWSPCSGILRAG